MKPQTNTHHKLTEMRKFWNQAQYDINAPAHGKDPGYVYYYHDLMDHLITRSPRYHGLGKADPRSPSGYRDYLVQKGYRVVTGDELVEIMKRQQEPVFTKLGVTPFWAEKTDEQQPKRSRREQV